MGSPSFSGGSSFYGQYANLGLYGSLVAYGTLNLTELSPPQSFAEPLSRGDARAFLNLPDSESDSPDPQEDDLMDAFISAARNEAEIAQGRDLVLKQWDLALDYWPSFRIELRAPLVTVDRVEYRDSNGDFNLMAEGPDYIVDKARQPGLISPPYNATWPVFAPWPTSALLIRFTSGLAPGAAWWSDTGGIVKAGMKYLISLWFNKRLPFQVGSSASDAFTTGLLAHGANPRVR
jgi:uncharacterized phiE125 gp8 family phage protein